MYRNRYFLAGILLILVGIQFRMIDSFVLNESATRALARVSKRATVANNASATSMLMLSAYPNPTKRVEPPRWLGLAMIAVGSIVACHAIAIPKL
jgi:hypothetical protein